MFKFTLLQQCMTIAAVGLLSPGIEAAEYFRCVSGGKVQFSQSPCPPGSSETRRHTPAQPGAASALAAHEQAMQTKARSESLGKVRQKSEKQHQDELRKRLIQQKAQQRKCEMAQLKVKWARQDLQHSNLKTQLKSQQKLERAEAAARHICQPDQLPAH